jgi:hypothetical protein
MNRIKEAGGAVEFIKGAWRVTTVEVQPYTLSPKLSPSPSAPNLNPKTTVEVQS